MRAAFYVGNANMSSGPHPAIEPGPGQAQIKVAYCGICGTDLHIFHGKMDHRVRPPQVIGHEMCGTISALGPGVEGFAAKSETFTIGVILICGLAYFWLMPFTVLMVFLKNSRIMFSLATLRRRGGPCGRPGTASRPPTLAATSFQDIRKQRGSRTRSKPRRSASQS